MTPFWSTDLIVCVQCSVLFLYVWYNKGMIAKFQNIPSVMLHNAFPSAWKIKSNEQIYRNGIEKVGTGISS